MRTPIRRLIFLRRKQHDLSLSASLPQWRTFCAACCSQATTLQSARPAGALSGSESSSMDVINTASHVSSMQAGAAWSAESQPLRGSILLTTRLPKRFWARLREPKRQSMIQRPRFTVTGRGRAYRASEKSSARSNLFLLPSLTDSFTTSHSKSVQTRTPSTTSALSDNHT